MFSLIPLLFIYSLMAMDIPFPDVLTPQTRLYRGITLDNEELSTLKSNWKIKDKIVVKSRLYRSFEKKQGPLAQELQIRTLTDQYVQYLKNQGLFYQIRYCHVDVWDCDFPSLHEFMGSFFELSDLPEELQKHVSNYSSLNRHQKADLLSIFDPFVSLTSNQEIAANFAGANGQVLVLKDVFARNCSEANMRALRCFINHEEYLEELEYPFIGYILSEELFAIKIISPSIY